MGKACRSTRAADYSPKDFLSVCLIVVDSIVAMSRQAEGVNSSVAASRSGENLIDLAKRYAEVGVQRLIYITRLVHSQ